ncbi:helix-turn-helix transcriptional regulator [Streptomyces sp. NPDC006863]|uniref:helix-turn-helix domain-containing protein n=1 Tax=Streptomyces sp. NPDC006863 TaxID=3154779 RepID=UPI0033C0CB0D
MSAHGPAAKRIGEHLRRLRRQAGMSQAEAGVAIAAHRGAPSWSRQAVNAAERGNRAWTADDVVALAATFGVTPGSLFEEVPTCGQCHGTPPIGFSCLACGATAEGEANA